MISSFALLVAAASIASTVRAQATSVPVIDTPTSLVQCLPSLVTYSGGTLPYYISAIPAGQAGAAALADLGMQKGSGFTWTVNVAAGTSLTLQIRDANGAINYSRAVAVQPSNNSTCLGAPLTTAPSGSTPQAATPVAAPTSGTQSGSSPATGTSTPSGSPPSTNTSTSSPATSTPNKSPSPFVPSTDNTTAPNNAPKSFAVPGSAINYHGLYLGLAIVAISMAFFV